MAGIKLKNNLILVSALFMTGTMLTTSSTALAGFQWKGTGNSLPAEKQETMIWSDGAPPASAQKVAPVEKAPMVLSAPVMDEKPMQLHAPSPKKPVMAAPVTIPEPMPAPKAVAEQKTPAPIAEQPFMVETKTSSDNAVVSGFGSDLPLVLVLQQVIPEGYQFTLADGVNPDTFVSWKGGKPWQEILSTTLAANDLQFKLQNKMVTVAHSAPNIELPSFQPVTITPTEKEAPPTSLLTPAPVDQQPTAPFVLPPLEDENMAPISITPVAKEAAVPDSKKKAEPLPLSMVEVPELKEAMPLPPLEPEIQWDNTDPMTTQSPVMANPVEEKTTKSTATLSPATRTSWTARQGSTLRTVLGDWAKKVNIELYWSIDYDYKLQKDISLQGNFEEAVANLMTEFTEMRPQPYGQLHIGASGPRVLVVKSYDLPH